MSNLPLTESPTPLGLQVFQPRPNVYYNLDTAALLAGIPRRFIVLYCRCGLVRPVIQQPYGVLEFTRETIYTIRQIERWRTVRKLDAAWLRSMFDLLNEVEHVRAELAELH